MGSKEDQDGGSSEDAVTSSDSIHPVDQPNNTEQVQDRQPKPPPAEEPPDGGYGWVCVACCFLINAHTWGLNSSYGVFLAYYLSNQIYPGATRLDFAFIGGLSISQALLVSPIATMTTRRFGTQVTLLVGIFWETLALIGASFSKEIWQLFLSQGVCFGWGMGFLFVGSVGVPPQWFSTRRSLANGIAAAGSGFGGLIYSLAANQIIQRYSLGWAFRALGIISCVVNLACAAIIRDRNVKIGAIQIAFDYKLFKRPEFVLLELWGFFSMLGYVVLLFSLPNFANYIGLTAHQGSVVGAVLQLGQMVGRPPVGYFSDTFGRINMAGTMTFLCGLFSLLIWIFAKSYGLLIFFAFIGGCVAGTFWATIGPVGAEVIGLKHLPSGLSITWLFLVIPCTFSEAIALEIVSATKAKYLGAQLFAGFMYIAAWFCIWLIRGWKIRENELKARDLGSEESIESEKPQISLLSAMIKGLVSWEKV